MPLCIKCCGPCQLQARAALQVQQLIADATARINYDQLEAGIRRIQGYTSVSKKTVTTVCAEDLSALIEMIMVFTLDPSAPQRVQSVRPIATVAGMLQDDV